MPERPSGSFVRRGVPGPARSDDGPEFTAKAVRERPGRVGVTTLYVGPGRPWESGYIESFKGKLTDELLGGGVLDAPLEAKVLIARHRVPYNAVRPRSSLGYRPPVPGLIVARRSALGASPLGPVAMAGAVT